MNDHEETDSRSISNTTDKTQWLNSAEKYPVLTDLFTGETEGSDTRRAFRNTVQRMRKNKGIDNPGKINDIKL